MKRKYAYLLTIFIFSVNVSLGQADGIPNSFKECMGQDVFFQGFHDKADYTKTQEKAYVSVKGKYKPVSKVKGYKDIQLLEAGKIYHIVGPITIDDAKAEFGRTNEYYHFISKDKDFYLPTYFCETTIKYAITPCGFWESELNRLQEEYAYIDTIQTSRYSQYARSTIKLMKDYEKNDFIHVPGMYLFPIEWIRFEYDVTSVYSTKFYAKTKASDTLVLFYKEIKDLRNHKIFVSKTNANQAIEQNSKDSILDEKTFVGTIQKRISNAVSTSGKKHIFEIGDKIPFVEYTEEKSLGKFVGLYLGEIYLIYEGLFSFDNPTDGDFLKRRKEVGYDVRMTFAKQYDSVAAIRYAEMLKKQEASEDSIKRDLQKKEILILNADYTTDYEYYVRCGIEFTVFNCYNKAIKYIDFTVVPYNRVGDIQGDDFNRRERTAHYIGPMKIGEKQEMSFSELFWDEHDAIETLKVTKVKITFTDGTTKVYSGVENVKKHAKKMELGY